MNAHVMFLQIRLKKEQEEKEQKKKEKAEAHLYTIVKVNFKFSFYPAYWISDAKVSNLLANFYQNIFCWLIQVARYEDLSEQIGKDIYFDLVDHDKVRSFRVQKQTSFNTFKVVFFLLKRKTVLGWDSHLATYLRMGF